MDYNLRVILKIKNNVSSKTEIAKAVETLSLGGVIVYPTDTAYGLGVDATNSVAVEKLYQLKGRSEEKPTHVVVKDWEMICEYCEVDERVKRLYDAFMPGPLTIVLRDKGLVDKTLGAGSGTLGVRIPDCEFTKRLSEIFGKPFTTPSANRSGGKTPYSIGEVEQELGFLGVDLVFDAGKLKRRPASTVVDLSGENWKVLRAGPISEDQIQKVLG